MTSLFANFITVKNNQEIRIIPLMDLISIQVEDYFARFQIENSKEFCCTKSLKEMGAILPENFIRINKNCIVNLQKVQSFNITTKKLRLVNCSEFIVSVRSLPNLKMHLMVRVV